MKKRQQRITSNREIVALFGAATRLPSAQGDGEKLCLMLNQAIVHKATKQTPKNV